MRTGTSTFEMGEMETAPTCHEKRIKTLESCGVFNGELETIRSAQWISA